VRLKVRAILTALVFLRASDFSVRTSDVVHDRRFELLTIFPDLQVVEKLIGDASLDGKGEKLSHEVVASDDPPRQSVCATEALVTNPLTLQPKSGGRPNRIIRYVQGEGIPDDAALTAIKDDCINDLKNMEATGLPIETEADVFREAIAHLEQIMDRAIAEARQADND
jgi:hypothetical protein